MTGFGWPRCPQCKGDEYNHLIDEAHGVHGTYMAGSERFVCAGCSNHTVTAASPNAAAFPFLYEKVAALTAGEPSTTKQGGG